MLHITRDECKIIDELSLPRAVVPDELAAVPMVGGRGVERVFTLVATVVTVGTIAVTMVTH